MFAETLAGIALVKSAVDGIKSAIGTARETIDAKLAAEHRQEIATLIDLRFGHGTWQSIINERAKPL